MTDLTHIKDKSYYNHNFYKLDEPYNGCLYLLEDCNEEYDSYDYILGDEAIFENEHKGKYFYGSSEYYIEDDKIDLDKIDFKTEYYMW